MSKIFKFINLIEKGLRISYSIRVAVIGVAERLLNIELLMNLFLWKTFSIACYAVIAVVWLDILKS